MALADMVMIVAAVAAFASVLALGLPFMERDKLQERLKAVAARRQELSARQRAELKGGRRAPARHMGLMKAVLGRLKLMNVLEDRDLRARLARAGWRTPSAAVTFTFARIAAPVLLLALGLVYVSTVFAHLPGAKKALILVGVVALGVYLPQIILTNAVQKRQLALARSFPDAMDLMLICVESGLSVETALSRVADEMAAAAPELAEEFGLTAAELAFLSDRRMAWENLAERTGLPAVKSLTTALVQAEKYGTPVGQALRVLVAETRESRMAEAEKKAAALPAKLTVPMILFFLPVLFLVIAGPAAIQVMGLK